jgi:zinc transporter ZupT
LLIGVAMGLLCHVARLDSRDEDLFFICAVAACGAVLGGVAAAPLLGYVSNDAAHFSLAEAVGSIVGSAAVMLLARAFRTSRPRGGAVPHVFTP